MATKTFASLVPRVSPNVPGCPTPTMVQYIREAAIRVCEQTLAWRYELPKVDLVAGAFVYAYNNPAGTDVHAILRANCNGNKVVPLTLEQAVDKYPKWAEMYGGVDPNTLWALTPPSAFNDEEYNEDTFNGGETFSGSGDLSPDQGEPRNITQLSPDKFLVLPNPDDTKTYTMRMFVALKPQRAASGMADAIMNELEDVIVHGALQQLLVLPKQNWTDNSLASYHAKQYRYFLTERRARANLGNMRAGMTVQFPGFGA